MARPTVADLRAGKGRRQLTMLHTTTLDETAAAHAAGIDLLSIVAPLWDSRFRSAAPDAFVCVGLLYGQLVTTQDYLRAAFAAMADGADSVYCAASLRTVEALAAEGIPVCGHTGLIPSKATWTGGFRAVGKTSDTALLVHRQVKALEDAGAFAAEIEVVPDRVAAEISRRSSLLLISMGAGSGCDAQYLFCSPRTSSAPTPATSLGTPSSTATSPPSTRGSRPNGPPPSASSPTTCGPAPTPVRATASRSTTPSTRPSWPHSRPAEASAEGSWPTLGALEPVAPRTFLTL